MLIGVGLGPGDPQLLTLQAVNVLKSAIKVFVPGRISYELTKPYADPEILQFPMTYDEAALEAAWHDNVEAIAAYAVRGRTAFGVLGDPNVFSTFSHISKILRRLMPHIDVETVPGVSSVTAAFSRVDESIEGSFVVSDGSPVQSTLVLKATRPRELAASLQKRGFFDLKLLENGFTERERVYSKDFPLKGEYFSIMYGKRP
ncbi:MAG TPA: cobalt-factor II C(20)-methyltransferase [Candidatus Bathyarchaeia archaeon]|nr:cobalt-factor II C(20)-methyltransferase [Candidatus Bathyarchaeia archaeon]